DLARDRVLLGLLQADQGHPGTVGGEPFGEPRADSACRAGDQHNLASHVCLAVGQRIPHGVSRSGVLTRSSLLLSRRCVEAVTFPPVWDRARCVIASGMTIELGKVGIWRHAAGLSPELAVQIERLGYGAVWIGGSPPADLELAERLLDATSTLAVATSIVNMWSDAAEDVARSYHRITAKHP